MSIHNTHIPLYWCISVLGNGLGFITNVELNKRGNVTHIDADNPCTESDILYFDSYESANRISEIVQFKTTVLESNYPITHPCYILHGLVGELAN